MAEAETGGHPTDKLFGLLSENEKLASDLIEANQDLVLENEVLTQDLVSANRELVLEVEKLTAELALADQEIERLQEAGVTHAAAQVVSDEKIHVQQDEKEELAAELVMANEAMVFQQAEKGKRAAELKLLHMELAQETETRRRSAELMVVNLKLAAQNKELEKRATELVISNRERMELLAQLLQSQKLESLGTLAGGIAHDMNNVLGAILGLSTAHMEIQPPTSPAFRAFETISKAAVRGGEMAKRLLNFARHSPAEEHEVDVNTILREEVRLLARTTLSKVHLNLELTPDLRPMRGDGSALTHAFMNLCVNAVDAMPEDGTLTLRTLNVDNDWIEVEVADTGTGMSSDVLEKALNPFFTTKLEGKGTGLGLSLVYSTVKAHRGFMDIQSEPGHGTRVMMRFPACEWTVPAESSEVRAFAAPGCPGLTVLLVDDDELIQSSAQVMLELLGHTVTVVPSGEDALARMAAGFRPHVVILDMNMPGLGGARTLKELRGLYPTLPVLVSTGRVDQAALNLVEAYPHVTLLPKPYALKELKAHLDPLG